MPPKDQVRISIDLGCPKWWSLIQVARVQKMLGDEYGAASNIKNRVNRLSVLSAITSGQQRLKLYNKVNSLLWWLTSFSIPRFLPMVLWSIQGLWWLMKAKRRKWTSILSPSNQSTLHCIFATTNSILKPWTNYWNQTTSMDSSSWTGTGHSMEPWLETLEISCTNSLSIYPRSTDEEDNLRCVSHVSDLKKDTITSEK